MRRHDNIARADYSTPWGDVLVGVIALIALLIGMWMLYGNTAEPANPPTPTYTTVSQSPLEGR